MAEDWRKPLGHFIAGGVAGMTARTVIAPIERVKIIYQTTTKAQGQGVSSLFWKVVQESGGGARAVTAFWKGNSVAVVRVFPYLGIQLSTNEHYKKVFGGRGLSKEVHNFTAGGLAGMTAVFTTYPLDLARARMALLMEQGAVKVPSMAGTIRDVYAREGFLALYSGAGISMTGAGIYCGIKFASYDYSKAFCRKYLLPDPEGPASALHRAASGGLAGVFAQTFVYPFDVLRRRLQTGGAEAREKYPDTVRGLMRLYRDEGFVRGLYRGCSLNYLKTVPNTTIYLALFDFLKDHID